MIPLPESMKAMILKRPGQALELQTIPVPSPQRQQVLVKVIACGVCRTDIHIVDGELDQPRLPLIPGHEIIGVVAATGEDVCALSVGDHIGIPWLGYTCGRCRYCLAGKENLCSEALFTGYTVNGGFAEYTVAWEKYCILLPPEYSNTRGAPLLCAGLIGYRCYRKLDPQTVKIGLYGFGAAAHLLTQVVVFQGKKVYAFTALGDKETQAFARSLGACWAGDSAQLPPEILDAAILFAPVGSLVPQALAAVDKGGQVICGGIHMSDIPSFPYSILWGERSISSVANLTRKDADDYFSVAPKVPVTAAVTTFPLQKANEAIQAIKSGLLQGAAVLDLHLAG